MPAFCGCGAVSEGVGCEVKVRGEGMEGKGPETGRGPEQLASSQGIESGGTFGDQYLLLASLDYAAAPAP